MDYYRPGEGIQMMVSCAQQGIKTIKRETNKYPIGCPYRSRQGKAVEEVPGMKAYKVYNVNGNYATIIFAENAVRAKSIAILCDAFMVRNSFWSDLRAERVPSADHLYKGEQEIDWNDPKQRKFLEEEMGWDCIKPSYKCNIL